MCTWNSHRQSQKHIFFFDIDITFTGPNNSMCSDSLDQTIPFIAELTETEEIMLKTLHN